MGQLLTPEETAVRMSVSTRTLREWRKNKYGPPSLRLSHTKVRYREEDVEEWIEAEQRGE